jgi:DNA-binding MarR family transcriptional regulator
MTQDMAPDEDDEDQVVLPALLRAARGSYAHAVRRELVAAGCEDLPRNAPFVLGGMVNHHGNPADLVRQLGVSKQAASQLVDVLVARGYLQRQPDPGDGRRITLAVTDRGRAAAAAVRAGVQWVDGELSRRLSAEQVAGLRAGLVALCDIRDALET